VSIFFRDASGVMAASPHGASLRSKLQPAGGDPDVLRSLRRENAELKAALSAQAKMQATGGTEGLSTRGAEVIRLEEQLARLRKRSDEVRQAAVLKKAELTRWRERLHDIERESQPILTDDSPLTLKIRMLEDRLDSALIKSNEAHAIRRTYEQIVERLRADRLGFDTQLAAIERTLRAKDHDYQELLNLSHDANHAKELAKAELGQFRAAYTEERRQKDQELAERKRHVQARIDQTQRLERREKQRRQQEQEASERAEEEKRRMGGGVGVSGNLFEFSPIQQQSAEDQERLAQYEEAFRRVQEATGVRDVHEVLQKFLTQEETHRSLDETAQEAQARIDELGAEVAALRGQLEEIRYSGPGHLDSRRIVDEFETHLTEAQHQCEQSRQRYERVARTLIDAKAGIEHLYDRLALYKADAHRLPMSDNTVVEILKQCESKLLLLTEEVAPMSEGSGGGGGGGGRWDDLPASIFALPAGLRSMPGLLPSEEGPDDDVEGGEEEEEEDVLDRETVKKLASIAVARETKRLKKRRAKGRGADD